MIELTYDGGMGNQMFQYCFARMLAEDSGSALKIKPVMEFPETFNKVNGEKRRGKPVTLICSQEKPLSFSQALEIAKVSPVKLVGFFQHFNHYSFNRTRIKKWFEVPSYSGNQTIGAKDVVVHVRLGDYVKLGLALDFSFYQEILDKLNYDRVFVVTNEPEDPFIEKFKPYKANIVFHRDHIQDFCFMMKFKTMILSASTFSFWAAYLSDCVEEYYWPIPQSHMTSNYLRGMVLDKPGFHVVENVAQWQRNPEATVRQSWLRRLMERK